MRLFCLYIPVVILVFEKYNYEYCWKLYYIEIYKLKCENDFKISHSDDHFSLWDPVHHIHKGLWDLIKALHGMFIGLKQMSD